MNPILAVANHWAHLMAAITLLGSTIFLRLAVHPATKNLEGEAKEGFERGLRRKAAMLIHASFMLLIITGFINFVRRFNEGVPISYNLVFGVKFLLAMVILGIALMLTIPSEALEKVQSRRPHWLAINIVLGLIVVLLSAWLRLMK